jgi:hypothetical protein
MTTIEVKAGQMPKNSQRPILRIHFHLKETLGTDYYGELINLKRFSKSNFLSSEDFQAYSF